jgi:hypothetical protein
MGKRKKKQKRKDFGHCCQGGIFEDRVYGRSGIKKKKELQRRDVVLMLDA